MKKTIRLFAALLCISLLSGCQLRVLDKDPTKPTVQETTRPTQETLPVEDPAQTSLKHLRNTMDAGSVFGAAYFGYHDTIDSDEPVDPYGTIEAHASQLSGDFPFLLEIPKENVVGGDNGDLICIVPKDPQAAVRINRCTWNGDDYIYDIVVYESDKGDPVLLFCNNAGIEPDTQVVITAPDGTETVWYPMQDNNQCLKQLHSDDDVKKIFDFSPYWELLLSEYIEACSNGWIPADEEMLVGDWKGADIRVDGSDYFYEVTFRENYTADIYWYDGEYHEYLEAPWWRFERNGFNVLAIDLGTLAGVREYNVLWEENMGVLYFVQDVSNHAVQWSEAPLKRYLYLEESTTPVPEDMIGTWNLAWTEVEGDRNEVAPGVGVVEIWQDSEGTLWISNTNRDFTRNNFQNKTLAVFGGEMYYGCGNDQWVADVGYIGPDDTFFAVTLLEDGTLLMQTYWEFDGQMGVSYAGFTRG